MGENGGKLAKKIPSFFKPFFAEDREQRLLIPPAFSKYMEEMPPEYPILKDRKGKVWAVEVVKDGSNFFFRGGWPDFVEEEGLQVGDFLVFQYDGKSCFTFQHYDTSTCEKGVKVSDFVEVKREQEQGDQEEYIGNEDDHLVSNDVLNEEEEEELESQDLDSIADEDEEYVFEEEENDFEQEYYNHDISTDDDDDDIEEDDEEEEEEVDCREMVNNEEEGKEDDVVEHNDEEEDNEDNEQEVSITKEKEDEEYREMVNNEEDEYEDVVISDTEEEEENEDNEKEEEEDSMAKEKEDEKDDQYREMGNNEKGNAYIVISDSDEEVANEDNDNEDDDSKAEEEEDADDDDEEEEEEEEEEADVQQESRDHINRGQKRQRGRCGAVRRGRRRYADVQSEENAVFASGTVQKPIRNAYFVAKLNLVRPSELYIPMEVIKDFRLQLSQSIVIRDEHGRDWIGKLKKWKDGRIWLCKGWGTLCRRNDVQPGDRCLCEFIPINNGQDHIIQVRIIRAGTW